MQAVSVENNEACLDRARVIIPNAHRTEMTSEKWLRDPQKATP